MLLSSKCDSMSKISVSFLEFVTITVMCSLKVHGEGTSETGLCPDGMVHGSPTYEFHIRISHE